MAETSIFLSHYPIRDMNPLISAISKWKYLPSTETIVVWHVYLYICMYMLCLSVCLSVRLYLMNRSGLNFCGTSHDPSEGLWMIKIAKVCVQSFLILINFEHVQKYIIKSANFCFVL